MLVLDAFRLSRSSIVHNFDLYRWLNDESGCREDRSSCPNGCGVRYVISEPVAVRDLLHAFVHKNFRKSLCAD